MEKEQPKRFTKEELKQLSNLAKSGTKYTLTENDFKELKDQMKRRHS